MTFASIRLLVLALLLISIGLLIPGLFLPVLTIRGVLTREGVAQVAPSMLDKGLNAETVKVLESMMNPQMIGFLKAMGGDLRKMIIEKLTPEVTRSLQQGMQDVEVYSQTRSIVSAVRNLYDVGSPTPATLILLFSVIVPVTKAVLVGWAFFLASGERRRRTLQFVEAIAKWSMADVFVVGIFIAYLAAQATQTPPGNPNAAPMIKFDAQFGPGFYWFAGYCLFSLASQQFTYRVAARAAAVSG